MDIGFLQAYFARDAVGGGERHTEELARALMQRGHDVRIFTDRPTSRRDGIDDLEVFEYSTPAKLNPITEITLAQKAFNRMAECDVVVLTDDSAWRGVDLDVPTVMVFHLVWHGWVHRHRPIWRVLREKPQALLYRWMERRIFRKANAIVSISPNVKEDIRLIGEDDGRLVDIPNGVDVDRFSPDRGASDEFIVYFQGRLVEMKNPRILIDAVKHSDGEWKLRFGGDGPLRSELEEYVRTTGLTDRIEFLGYVPDEELPKYYAEASVFVLPSTYEGMPLTVLEAAASGTAIMASERAATDFVTASMGETVSIDAREIAERLDRLSGDRARVDRMGMAARSRAEEYSWSSIAGRYERLFESLSSADAPSSTERGLR